MFLLKTIQEAALLLPAEHRRGEFEKIDVKI